MRTILLLVALSAFTIGYGQSDGKISAIDFVQILNANEEETLFYYENNWKVLRDKALEKNYIASYQLLKTPFSSEEPFQIMLITTYPNQKDYEQREERFDELIAQRGPIRLMNQKKPGEFRKILFSKLAYHLH